MSEPAHPRCSVCNHPLAEQINEKLVRQVPVKAIQAWLEEQGTEDNPVHVPHRNTISEHKLLHLSSEKAQAVRQLLKRPTARVTNGDLAVLVRDLAAARVESGDIQPTLNEGLRAQEMLDRRAEKSADRDLAKQLAQLLGGAISPLALPEPVIEGNWIELGAERAEDEQEMRLLASGE